MNPVLLASAIAVLIAPVVLQPGRTAAQVYGGGHRGFGSPGFHPPAYAPPNYGRPRIAPPRAAAHMPSSYDPERPGRSGWRRGERLPPSFRGDIVSDYARYHLRRPPRGFAWYRDADDYVLAAMATGVIFDVISGD